MAALSSRFQEGFSPFRQEGGLAGAALSLVKWEEGSLQPQPVHVMETKSRGSRPRAEVDMHAKGSPQASYFYQPGPSF